VAWKSGYLDWHELCNFLEIDKNLLGDGSISQMLITKAKQIIDKTSGANLLNLLQTYYLSFSENSKGGFLLWTSLYLMAKYKYPEMMAFAYSKLITEREVINKIQKIILEIIEIKGNSQLKNKTAGWQEILDIPN
jgi:hypothetical protein